MTTTVTDPAVARPPAPAGGKDFRYDIGGLRGLAILIVVTGHLFERSGYLKWPDWISTFVAYVSYKLGDLVVLDVIHIHGGVDMSFALSGYLITWLAIKEFVKYGRIHMKAFYARRARRLLPAATLVTLATLVGSWLWLSSLQLRDIATDAFFTSLPTPALNYWLAHKSTDYFAANTVATTPFQHYWSLNVEEQFYLIYPALLLLGLVIGRKIGRLRLVVGIMLAVIVAVSLTWSIVQTGTNQPMAYFGAHTRAWELALGALVAVAQPLFKRMRKSAGALLSWLGLATILVTICIIESYPLPGFAVGGPVLGVLMVIAGGESRPRFSAEALLRFRPLQYIGKISYQWYLWHWPMLIILPALLGRQTLSLADLFVVLIGSFALAAATWHLLDAPLRKRKDFDENPGKAIGMGVHLMIASIVASLVAMFALAPSSSATAPITAPARPVTEMERLVAEGAQLQQLSPEVIAALPNVKNDGQRTCIEGPLTVKPSPCSYGDKKSDKLIVLIGDSHALQWTPALDVIGKQRKLHVLSFAKAACTPESYLNIDYHLKRLYTECKTWRETVFAQIASKRPQAIILSAGIFDGASGEATKAMVTQLKGTSPHVILIDDTPGPFKEMPACLKEASSNAASCATPTKQAMYKPELRAERKAATIEAGGQFVDVVQWFCTATVCPGVVNNMIVYIDGSHVSATYMRWLAPKLEEVIRPALS